MKHAGKRLIRRGIQLLPFVPLLSRAYRRGHVMMIHVGRSGSTVVGDLLNQHPMIRWDGEIYQRIFRQRQLEDRSLPPITDVDPVSYLMRRSSSQFTRYYGFEIKFFHLRTLGTDLASYVDALEGRLSNLFYITLERKNTLRKVVSSVVAQATEKWHLQAGARPSRNRVHIDVDAVFVNRTQSSLLDLLEETARDFRVYERLMRERRVLHLTYEEDVQADPARAYERICEYLGLPICPITVRYERTNPYPLSELLANYDEIRSLLRGTDFEWMLED